MRALALLFAAPLALAGCGLQPVYSGGRNGAVVQGTTGGAAADRYCLRGFFAGRKKSDDHAGGAQS